MTGETLAGLTPLVITAVTLLGTGGKGVRYIKAIARSLVETI